MVSTQAGGGPDRVRTDDLLDANQALSQLSYGPVTRPSTLAKNLGLLPGRLGKPDKFRIIADPANGNVDHWPSIGRRSLERR